MNKQQHFDQLRAIYGEAVAEKGFVSKAIHPSEDYQLDTGDFPALWEQWIVEKHPEYAYLWEEVRYFHRADGRIERTCPHGIGHTTYESACRVAQHYSGFRKTTKRHIDAWLIHGCDGCCDNYPECHK